MSATFYIGDVLETMAKLPAGSVDLILTSPPFLALRSYLPADHPDKAKEGGSQSTPGEFIDWLIDFAEASARVLAPHGSFCVELGDTYAGGGQGPDARYQAKEEQVLYNPTKRGMHTDGGWPLAKSLSLIPELFRLSLVYGFNPLTGRTTERWRLRNVVRWVRPNPPVGALGDKFRPATSELMVFCKSAKRYFDLDAVREPHQQINVSKIHWDTKGKDETGNNSFNAERYTSNHPAGAPPLDYWNVPILEGDEPTRYGPPPPDPAGRNKYPDRLKPSERDGRRMDRPRGHDDPGHPFYGGAHPGGAPPLDWWQIPPGGYPGSHYATFPEELCVRPVKAMSPERVCRVCGEPSRRITEWTEGYAAARAAIVALPDPGGPGLGYDKRGGAIRVSNEQVTTGWSDCGHDSWRPGLILDPFGGSGTVAAVATGHGRDCILIDLDERNFDLALGRVGPFMLTLGNIDER